MRVSGTTKITEIPGRKAGADQHGQHRIVWGGSTAGQSARQSPDKYRAIPTHVAPTFINDSASNPRNYDVEQVCRPSDTAEVGS